MKVLLLGAGSVIHTQRWANGLSQAGVEVVCVSQHPFLETGWETAVRKVLLKYAGPAGYVLNAREVAAQFKAYRCDLLNAHYATGYGLLATLSGVRPRMVSVWGMDVFDFPGISPLHRWLVCAILRRADLVGSTSHVMAKCVRDLLSEDAVPQIAVTPFGVDPERFTPLHRARTDRLVVGTVKTLAPKYGIDILVRAFGALQQKVPPAIWACLRLRLVGDGPQRVELQDLVQSLGLSDRTEFVGHVAHSDVPAELNRLDVYVAASRLDSESFGVAVIEASACELPVVVTRVGGLPEVVEDGVTGYVVSKEDPSALADAIARLLMSPERAAEFGKAGRRLVERRYAWRACVATMKAAYEACLSRCPSGLAR